MSDEMLSALGRFMTEFGDVEYVMFEAILAVDQRDASVIHAEFYSTTFSPKVDMFVKAAQNAAFDEHRGEIDHLIVLMRKLIGQRNNIVHGETYYITKGGVQKVFRVGFTKKNFKPWENFDFKGNGEKIFEPSDIDDVIDVCIAIKVDLDRVRQLIIQKLTGHRPPFLPRSFVFD